MGTWDTSNDQEFEEGERVALTKKTRTAAEGNHQEGRRHTRRDCQVVVGAHMRWPGHGLGQEDKFGSCQQKRGQNKLRSERTGREEERFAKAKPLENRDRPGLRGEGAACAFRKLRRSGGVERSRQSLAGDAASGRCAARVPGERRG